MAAHLHAVLRATLGCRLALHPRVGTGTSFTLHATRPRPPLPSRRHDRASVFVPARGLAARASKKKQDAAAAIGAAKGGDDAKKADAAAVAAAKMVMATKKGAAVLDPQIPDDMKESWHVLQVGNEIYDATLNQTNVGGNNNKFFIIQALESDGGASWMVYWRYGRVSHRGRSELRGPMPRDQAVDLFEFKFKDKTGNDWSCRKKLSCRPDYYTWLEMDYGKGDDETGKTQKKYSIADQIRETKLETRTARFISVICDISMMKQQMMEIGYNAEKLPLGKISKSTIRKGYSILKRISSALPKADPIQLEELTGEFYTVIPQDFGFKKMREFIIDTPEKLKALL